MNALLLALAALVAQDPGQRWNPAAVAFEGPLERARFAQGARGTTEVEIRLVRGERRALEVPFAHRPLDPDALPAGPAGARFESWIPVSGGWEALPVGLRARSRPVPPVPAGGAPGSGARSVTVLALLATGAFVVGTRKKPPLALALGLVGAGVAGVLEHRRPAPGATALRVLEGEGSAGGLAPPVWIVVTAAFERLGPLAGSVLRVETAPEHAALEYGVRVAPGSPPEVSAYAPGADVLAFGALDVRGRRLTPDLNAWGPIEAAWTRTPDGIWTARRTWPLGEALPGDLPGAGAPPGWAAAGLPQGRGVLVARLAPDAWGAGAPGVEATWIRIVGF